MKKRKEVKQLKHEQSMFIYTSKCCGGAATKQACVKPIAKLGELPKPEESSSLGTWRCKTCGNPCSCNRHLNKLDKAQE